MRGSLILPVRTFAEREEDVFSVDGSAAASTCST